MLSPPLIRLISQKERGVTSLTCTVGANKKLCCQTGSCVNHPDKCVCVCVCVGERALCEGCGLGFSGVL